ncbi:MAG: hypothetical protein QHJ82_13855 [Verrucomicrobiota bacterium]|nr:hypothetical protein [Verrucomicrobiota bacterium]
MKLGLFILVFAIAVGCPALSPGQRVGPPRATSDRGLDFELIRDPTWALGFTVLAPKVGGGELGRIQFAGAPGTPVWQLAQWHSRFPFTNAVETGPELCLSNTAKWLCLNRRATEQPVLTLGVDSRPEYNGRLRRTPSESWPHLLIQQTVSDAPPIAALRSLRLRAEVCLREAQTFKPAEYSPSLHAAQFQIVLTLNNLNRGSPGFGDYLWFVVPVYDDRYDIPPEYIAPDFAVTKGKLIYNPGGEAVGLRPLRPGKWQSLDCDLLPLLARALRMAWAKGYLCDSRDLADYCVAHLNVGWEVPGANRTAIAIRGLSLCATENTAP